MNDLKGNDCTWKQFCGIVISAEVKREKLPDGISDCFLLGKLSLEIIFDIGNIIIIRLIGVYGLFFLLG